MNDFASSFYNESRWARKEEIQNASLKINLEENKYPSAGLPVMSDSKTAYIDPSDTHTVIFGSTGSKKTRLFCFPMINMMIRAGESFIATDPKGELFAKTSQAAADNGYKTIVLNFRDIGTGDCWNPFEIPYELYHGGNKDLAMSLINDFITALSEPHRKTTKDIFWIETAASLALANLLLLIESGEKEEVHLASFSNMCSMSNLETISKISRYLDENTIAGMNYRGVLTAAEKTLQSIQVSLYAWVRIFASQKRLTKMLSKNTFDVRNIGKEKTAVFIIVPDEKTTYHFLVTTFIKQVYETLISVAQETDDGKLPVRVNFILDEFCNLPAIPDMPAMISAARSRNMRYYLIVQGMHQLTAKYQEDAETIKGNCENWVFLTTKELSLLQEISDLCGDFITNSGHRRKLISVSELQRLNKEKGEVLLLYGRRYPFITEMPDIDEYEMYKTSSSLTIPLSDDIKYKMFSPTKIYRLLVHGKISLFADEKDCFDEDYEEDSANSVDEATNKKHFQESSSETMDEETIDLQKELEKKFDELFGNPNDEEEN